MSSPASFDPESCRTRVCASVSQDAALQASGSEWLPLKHPDCAAVVLEDDVGLLAVMTFFEDVPRTLSILNWCCLQTLPFSFRQRVFELLLEAVIAESKVRGLHNVRYLDCRQDRSGVSFEEPALTKAGFQRCVTACVWKSVQSLVDLRRRAVATSDGAFKIRAVDLPDLHDHPMKPGQIDRAQIETLINRVSDDSEDITRLPRPNPGELLQCWLTKQARALIACIDQQTAGFVVWSEGVAHDSIEVMFEYLGVTPDHRRHNIATTLMLNALHQIHRDHPRMPIEVSVLVDVANRPATEFYEALGFRRSQESVDVWLYSKPTFD